MCKCSKNDGFTLFPYIHKLHNNLYHLPAVQLLKASFFIWPILPKKKEKKGGLEKAIKYSLLLHFSQGWHWAWVEVFKLQDTSNQKARTHYGSAVTGDR